jgi:uncharacterized protein YeaC (DUF1315 family)
MDFTQLIGAITPEIHASLKRAVEIGRWPDGRRLTPEQRELSLQAIIAYEAIHLDERDRVGYIDRGSKAEGEVCATDHAHEETETLRWLESNGGA